MTPNVTQSISSRFSAASLLFSWDSRMSFRLAIFLSISADETRGFLDQAKVCKREHMHWHKWTEAIKILLRRRLAAKCLCALFHPEVTRNKPPVPRFRTLYKYQKLLITLAFAQIAALQISPEPALTLLISVMTEYD